MATAIEPSTFTSQFTGAFKGFNPVIAFIIIIACIFVIIMVLVLRKRAQYGQKRGGFLVEAYRVRGILDEDEKNNLHLIENLDSIHAKAGLFGSKFYFFGLWWSNDNVYRTDNGKEILGYSPKYFILINGQRGMRVVEHPTNPNKYIPIEKLVIEGMNLMMSMPDLKYNDFAITDLTRKKKVLSNKNDALMQTLVFAGLIVFALLSIIFIVQMIQHSQQQAKDLLIQAGDKSIEACRTVAREVMSVTKSASSAP